MFNSSNKKTVVTKATHTVIGEGVKLVSANLTGIGSLRIDGEFTGDIEMEDEVILGENGCVYGNISSRQALIAGTVEGFIKCKASIHATRNSSISGDIEASALIIDEGAKFNGSCKTVNQITNTTISQLTTSIDSDSDSNSKD